MVFTRPGQELWKSGRHWSVGLGEKTVLFALSVTYFRATMRRNDNLPSPLSPLSLSLPRRYLCPLSSISLLFRPSVREGGREGARLERLRIIPLVFTSLAVVYPLIHLPLRNDVDCQAPHVCIRKCGMCGCPYAKVFSISKAAAGLRSCDILPRPSSPTFEATPSKYPPRFIHGRGRARAPVRTPESMVTSETPGVMERIKDLQSPTQIEFRCTLQRSRLSRRKSLGGGGGRGPSQPARQECECRVCGHRNQERL